MSETKKTVPVLQHRDGSGADQMVLADVILSSSHDTTKKQTAQGLISSSLPSGSARAVSLRRLAEMTGLSTREVRRAIQRERLQGIPICEAGAGYFLAGTADERCRWVRSMRGRARQILKAARAVEKGDGVIGPKE